MKLRFVKNNFTVFWISALLHLAFVGLLLGLASPSLTKKQDIPLAPLNSYLITKSKPLIELSPSAAEKRGEAPAKAPQASNTAKAEALELKPQPAKASESVPNIEPNKQTIAPEAPTPSAKNIISGSQTGTRYNTTSAGFGALVNKHKDLLLGIEAAKEYRQQQNGARIDTSKSIDTTRVITTIKPKQINCENSAANTVAFIARFTGGNVQCSGTTNFEEFIQKRKDKADSR